MMNVPGGGLVSEQAFWVICGLFYLADNIRLLSGRELILAERFDRQWLPVFPLYHYRLRGRTVCFLNVLAPSLAAVRMTWLTHDPFSSQRLRRSDRLLYFYRRRLTAFRALSGILFVVFLIGGPILTHYAGLNYTLRLLLPIHIAALAVLIGLLVAGRRTWRLSWMDIGGLTCECAFCPGFFINVCRKLSLKFARVPGDAMAYTLAYGEPNTAACIASRLELCLDELEENGELHLDDESTIEAYRRLLRQPLGHE
jgi:hypothetical protein